MAKRERMDSGGVWLHECTCPVCGKNFVFTCSIEQYAYRMTFRARVYTLFSYTCMRTLQKQQDARRKRPYRLSGRVVSECE